ncbi:MAG TPA: NAD-dependent DNA ligase LigA, partial [Micromonosporaceae bacterium]
GTTAKSPRWGVAYKYGSLDAVTTLNDVVFQVGRMGHVTPVAVLEPVQVAGVTITSATLHNFADLVLRDVRVGDTVFVRRAGDVIPEITGAVLDQRPADAQPFAAPEVCPRCGGEIDKTQKRWRCTQGRACGARESLAYFVSRDAMDIEGMGDKILDALVAAGHVTDPADLYTLDVPTLAAMERMGTISATKLVAALDASKQRPLSRVLTGLGVRMTGRRLSRRLAQHFGTMAALQAADVEELQQVEGVGPERATVIAAELIDLAGVIAKLDGHGLAMTEPDATPAAAATGATDTRPLRKPDGSPYTVVVTGSVPGLTRNEGNEAVEELGGKSSGSVSARTDLVVIGDGAGSKADKAHDLGIRTMTADRFAEALAAFRAGEPVDFELGA